MERWNTHFSTCVEVEMLGMKLRLAQDPSSENLGTTGELGAGGGRVEPAVARSSWSRSPARCASAPPIGMAHPILSPALGSRHLFITSTPPTRPSPDRGRPNPPVWDASIVMAKYFEKNIRKGDFSRAKVRGKR
jgi:hypothetical protein